jgi:hypothetical protein
MTDYQNLRGFSHDLPDPRTATGREVCVVLAKWGVAEREVGMDIGDRVKIKAGATSWMKERNYWLPDMGDTIDGYGGEVVTDYTYLAGDDAHLGINIGFDFIVGVNPQFLELA